jgi:hypothetical protein
MKILRKNYLTLFCCFLAFGMLACEEEEEEVVEEEVCEADDSSTSLTEESDDSDEDEEDEDSSDSDCDDDTIVSQSDSDTTDSTSTVVATTETAAAATRSSDCTGLPDNNVWHKPTVTQTEQSDGSWDPSLTGVYSASETSGCEFHCASGYHHDGSSCISSSRSGTCSAVSDSNGSYNTVSSVTQSWDGSSWLPSLSTLFNVDPSTADCNFKCDADYVYDASACTGVDWTNTTTGNWSVFQSGLNNVSDQTAAVATVAEGNAWDKYRSGAVLGPNEMIYSIPYSATTVGKFDTSTQTGSTFGSLGSVSFKYKGGALSTNGSIYACPYKADDVLKIDTSDDSTTLITAGVPTEDYKYTGAARGLNGSIYCIPWSGADNVLKIDPSSDTVSTIGTTTSGDKWVGAVLAPNGIIYAFPGGTGTPKILKIDPSSDTVSEITSSGSLSRDFKGAALAPNGKIYALPNFTDSVLEFDPDTETYVLFGASTIDTSSGSRWNGAVLGANGMIYGIPDGSGSYDVLEVNPETQGVRLFGALGSVGWTGGVLAKDGFIYAPGGYRSNVLKINTGAVSYDSNVLLNPWHNNN